MKKNSKRWKAMAMAVILLGGLLVNPVPVQGASTSAAEAEQTVNSIMACDNYIIYYGYKFTSSVMNKLKTYDLVVINPLETGAASARKELQASGIKVYAYSSSIEIPTYDTELVSLVSDSEKLSEDGKILTHWESNQLGDLRQSSFRTTVISKIKERIYDAGYDGVFVDTLDDLENMGAILEENQVTVSDETAYIEEMEDAGVLFLQELELANPDISIIQNRAFQLLDKGAGSLVDGVLYEDICKSADAAYYNEIKTILDRYTTNDNGVVMALANQKKYYTESLALARENKWLYYQTTDYTSTSIVNGSSYKIDIDGSGN